MKDFVNFDVLIVNCPFSGHLSIETPGMNAKSANRQIIAGQATVDLIKEIWQSSSSSHMIVRMINLITLIIAQCRWLIWEGVVVIV